MIPAEISARVVMHDSLVVALPDTHELAGAGRLSIARLARRGLRLAPTAGGSELPDRLRRLAQDTGFVPDTVQVAPDTQTALALVSAEVGCHLTLASVAENATDPHVVFVPLDASAPDVHLRAAWRRDDKNPALSAVLAQLLALDVTNM